jgi:hypothetical protein
MKRASDPDVIDLAQHRRQRDGVTFDDIARLRLWVAWQNEPAAERPTKVPYSAAGRRASSTDPATWLTRDQAERVRDRLPFPCGDGGIGIILGADLGDGRVIVGIDLDTCREAGGTLTEWAGDVIARFGSYAEISPSGSGCKLFGVLSASDLPPIRAILAGRQGATWKWTTGAEHPPAIELYTGGRYFTVTGEPLPDSPAELRPIAIDAVRWLVREAGPAFVASDPATRKGSVKGDRSAAAYRLAQRLAGKTYDDYVAALQADPELAAWYVEKGQRSGEREAKRTWERAQAADPAVAELNETFALVLSGGRTAILKEDGDEWALITVDAFRQWHANRFAPAGANAKPLPLATFWLTHAQRRQYDGIVFAPQRDTPGKYNLWRGFAIEPRAGACGRFLAHILENVCQGETALFDWVIGWFADIVQHPDRKMRHRARLARPARGRQDHCRQDLWRAPRSALCRHRRPALCHRPVQLAYGRGTVAALG